MWRSFEDVSEKLLRVSFSMCGFQVVNDRQLGCREGGTAYHTFPVLAFEF